MADPAPGDSFTFRGNTYQFQKALGKLNFVMFEVGKAARVYKVICNGKPFALKSFFPKYRSPRNVKATNQISTLKNINGLSVANRFCITRDQNPEIVNRFEGLEYGVLMPWVRGQSWSNYLGSRTPVTPDQSICLSRAIATTISELENHQLAHCDISNGNFLILNNLKNIELIDIEEIFSQTFATPNPIPVGTDGYAPEWVVENGYWAEDADRFAAVMLCVEVLCWQNSQIRENSESESLFASGEFGFNSKRYKLVMQYLSKLSYPGLKTKKLVQIFDATWHSHSLQNCPTVQELKAALYSQQQTTFSVEPGYIDFGRVSQLGMVISNNSLTFRIINTGDEILTGKIIINVNWLDLVSDRDFSIEPEAAPFEFTIKLNTNIPHYLIGQTYMFPKCITIQTNAGIKVIGGQYFLPKSPKYQTEFK